MGVSAAAWIFFRRGTGFIAATLKSVPAVCAAMGLIAPFSVVGAWRVIPPIPNFLTPIIAGILPVFCAGFLAHMFYARKCGFSFFKTLLSFAAGVLISAAVAAAVFAVSLWALFTMWESVEIPAEPKFELQLKRKPALCPEFDRRVKFESGKTVGISLDTCGRGNFSVYALRNGAVYFESEYEKYIIDPRAEKVCEVLGANVAELKGGLINGRWGAEGKVSYDVYGCGGEETFESQTSPLGDALENKRKIGDLRVLRFIPETPN